jgi:hypothetical protein
MWNYTCSKFWKSCTPPPAQIRVKHMYILKNYIWVHRTPPTSRKIYCAQHESFLGWIRSNLSLVLLVNNEKSLTRFVGLSLPEGIGLGLRKKTAFLKLFSSSFDII